MWEMNGEEIKFGNNVLSIYMREFNISNDITDKLL
jgi:hypothetical protein